MLWLWTLLDTARFSDAAWRAAGASRTMWLLLIFVPQFFGTLFYLLWIRPKLGMYEPSAPL
jgi:Phospholipase_D-nuclease N-terminal